MGFPLSWEGNSKNLDTKKPMVGSDLITLARLWDGPFSKMAIFNYVPPVLSSSPSRQVRSKSRCWETRTQ